MNLSDIGVRAETEQQQGAARQLADELGLAMARPGKRFQLLLTCSEKGLAVCKPDDPNLGGSVRVDFSSNTSSHRLKQQKQELIVRAVAGKGGTRPKVLDATGGLGRDAFILAAAGCRVTIVERLPIVAALLGDGLQRALHHPGTESIAERIDLLQGDSVCILREMQERGREIEVVYLDPMFPQSRKSALVKKELQVLQMLTTEDKPDDGGQLLQSALGAASKRVVLKRPRKAPYLTDYTPDFSLTAKTIRFDVYLVQK